MALASLQNIEKTFGPRVIFDQLTFAIDRGERVGLIGDNGSGKTTLFKMLTGQILPDAGQRVLADGLRLGHLLQDPVFNPDNTVTDEAELAFAPLHELSHRLRQLEHDMATLAGDALEKILNKYQQTQHDFELAGGYAWRHRLEAMLAGVGLDKPTWEQNVTTLSGGQRSRLALAKILIEPCDLLLLDEPTNHLDLAAIAWLEDYLATFAGAVLLISHDRYLLDRLATRIVWLQSAHLKSYPGNYSAFVEQRALHELSQQRAYEEQQADIAKQSEFIRRFRAGQRAKEAQGRQKHLDRLLAGDDLVHNVQKSAKIRLPLNTDRRAGDRVLRTKDLGKSFGPVPMWKDVNLDISRGERIGLIGPNASGKTTLLETLLGRIPPDTGEIRWGANLHTGYYDQHLGPFNPDNTVAQEVQGQRPVKPQDLRAVLALMLFRGPDIDKSVRLLSGGERARVAMAQLLLDRPNVLILDEPTNHLDIQSCEALENALADFPGTILCVSHDRYFLDKIAQRLLILDPPLLISFDGNFTAWSQHLARQAAAAAEARRPRRRPASPPAGAPPKPAKSKSNNPWSRPFGRLSVADLEKQIAQTEAQIAACQQHMADPSIARDPARSRQLVVDHDLLAKKLRDLEAEYFQRGE